MPVAYRLPAGTDIGYLELLPSPWNESRTILAVLGSTPTGLQWSARALVDPALRSQLAGNFAVVNDLQVLSADTRLGLGTRNLSATAIPGDHVGIVAPLGSPPPPISNLWILPTVGASSLAILFVLAIVVRSSLLQRDTTRKVKGPEDKAGE
jgi:hypothetical protein